MAFGLTDVAFSAYAMRPHQRRQTALHAASMFSVDGFERLRLLQYTQVGVDVDATPSLTSAAARMQRAGLAGYRLEAKLGAAMTMSDAMIRRLTARTSGSVGFPIYAELILRETIRQTTWGRLNAWSGADQVNTPLLALGQIRSADIARITQLFSGQQNGRNSRLALRMVQIDVIGFVKLLVQLFPDQPIGTIKS